MRTLRSEIEIRASAEQVWQTLMDFGAHAEWNPFIPEISGTPISGHRLEVLIKPPGTRGMRFRPTVLVAKPPREFRWLGRIGISMLFDGEHTFQILPLTDNKVLFSQEENFTGLLVPLLWRSLETNTRAGFQLMNKALKQRVEKLAASQDGGKKQPGE